MTESTPSALSSTVFRPLRRRDEPKFLEVVMMGVGNLERSTGLDASAEALIRSLFRRSIWFLTRFLSGIGRPIVSVVVAEEGSRLVGTGMILWLPNSAYVSGMATRPECRGRGVASRILALLQSQARRRRRDWMTLDVESENDTAIRVYLKAGYREVAEFSWLTRTGSPSATGPVAAECRPMRRADGRTIPSRLDAARPETYRAVFPATPRVLNHNEFLVRGMGSRSQTWVKETAQGVPCVLRTYFSPAKKLGAFFLMTGVPEPSPEELTSLVNAGASWMEPLGPERCLAVLPISSVATRVALERAGFVRVVGSKTMVRPSAE